MVARYQLLRFPLSTFGGGGNGVVGPLFVSKVDPDAICLFLDGVLKPLKPPPSKSLGISLNSGSPCSILLIFLQGMFVS